MARVTVEDCLKRVNNRFDLVLLASKRARMLSNNKNMTDVIPVAIAEKIIKSQSIYRCPPYPLIEAGTDKPTVIALREIAAGIVTKSCMEQVEDNDVDLDRSKELALSQRLPMNSFDPSDD